MYYFFIYIFFSFSECWCNRLLKCVSVTYQKYFFEKRKLKIHFKQPHLLKDWAERVWLATWNMRLSIGELSWGLAWLAWQASPGLRGWTRAWSWGQGVLGSSWVPCGRGWGWTSTWWSSWLQGITSTLFSTRANMLIGAAYGPGKGSHPGIG